MIKILANSCTTEGKYSSNHQTFSFFCFILYTFFNTFTSVYCSHLFYCFHDTGVRILLFLSCFACFLLFYASIHLPSVGFNKVDLILFKRFSNVGDKLCKLIQKHQYQIYKKQELVAYKYFIEGVLADYAWILQWHILMWTLVKKRTLISQYISLTVINTILIKYIVAGVTYYNVLK